MRARPARTATAAGLLAALCGLAPAAHARTFDVNGMTARVGPDGLVLRNDVVERRWRSQPFSTEAILERSRGGPRRHARSAPDFELEIAGRHVDGADFDVAEASAEGLGTRGLRLAIALEPRPGTPAAQLGLSVTRFVDVYRGIAGFRTRTSLNAPVPLTLEAAATEVAAVPRARPTTHALRAGADWREPGYEGPPIAIGDPHAGTWRETRRAPAGSPLESPAQWLSLTKGRSRVFLVMERNDLPSSRTAYDGREGALRLEYGRDVLGLGPFEEEAHVENPLARPGRARLVPPRTAFELEGAFLGLGRNAADEAWQFHRYLAEHRIPRYPRAVTFNTNGVDEDRISTGAKDDVDLETARELADVARRLGVETFILDDGWQARSGDWHPDSPQHPEPRWDGSADSRFRPRFPDPEFRAVREAIQPMRLGLWMSPLHFHPSSETGREHPEWICRPVGDALYAYNSLEPEDGSNEAGIVTWSAEALPHVEARIREAIERWGVRYWKFDFMAWLDCAGSGDLYNMRERFIAMIDRLESDYGRVTFQIDETNDYRLFPFESVSRGPTWFQNGTPDVDRLLHNLWNLSPYVPTFAIGQHALGGDALEEGQPVGTLMAAALLSHITFFSDIRELPPEVVEEAGRWLEFYKRERGLLGGVVYPLLDDPIEGGWTALQSWDPEHGRGALLAFRQDDDRAARRIPLRNVRGGGRYRLATAPAGRPAGSATAGELRRGLRLRLPRRGSRVITVRRMKER